MKQLWIYTVGGTQQLTAVVCLGNVVFNQGENDETSVVQSPAVCNCRLVAGHLSGGVGVVVESSRGRSFVGCPRTGDTLSGVKRDIQSLIPKASGACDSFFSAFCWLLRVSRIVTPLLRFDSA
jgi:hypothetical protein